jgi:hypothetical protein
MFRAYIWRVKLKIGDRVKVGFLEIESFHQVHYKYVYLIPFNGKVENGYMMVRRDKLLIIEQREGL